MLFRLGPPAKMTSGCGRNAAGTMTYELFASIPNTLPSVLRYLSSII